MVYEKVTENVYAITDGSTRGNVCAFELPSQLIFIDSGMNIPIVKKFREQLEAETGKKTTMLLISHVHGDHIYGNVVFKDCKVISHRSTKQRMIESLETQWTPEKLEELKKNLEDPTTLDGLEIIIPKETFETKMVIEDYDHKLIYKNTGGHTAGSSYVFYPEAKALVGGDNLFIGSFPWGGDATAHPELWSAAIKEYLSLDVDYYIPGHGPVSTKKELTEWKDYLDRVIILMRRMITEGHKKESIIKKADAIEYYPPRREQWKKLSLEKWYDVLSSEKKK